MSRLLGAGYQLLFDTPGSSPACAISRRQILHSPNLRKTACGRPHLLQRGYARTANFGFRGLLLISAFFAIWSVLLERKAEAAQQRSSFVVVRRRGDDGDVHATGPAALSAQRCGCPCGETAWATDRGSPGYAATRSRPAGRGTPTSGRRAGSPV